jgi:phenylalanyl-tRNA synthetase alpha chain
MTSLQDTIALVQARFKTEIARCKDLTSLESIRVAFMGRKGEIAQLMPHLTTLTQEEKRVYGPLLNDLKAEIEYVINTYKESLEKAVFKEKEEAYKFFDVTAYNTTPSTGS